MNDSVIIINRYDDDTPNPRIETTYKDSSKLVFLFLDSVKRKLFEIQDLDLSV